MVRLRDIIGIFDTNIQASTDLDKISTGRTDDHAFTTIHTHGHEVKSVIITDSHIYLSPISSLTLKRRAENLYGEIEEFDLPENTV